MPSDNAEYALRSQMGHEQPRQVPSAPQRRRHPAEVAFQIRLASQSDHTVTMTAAIRHLEDLLREFYCAGWDAAEQDAISRAMDGRD